MNEELAVPERDALTLNPDMHIARVSRMALALAAVIKDRNMFAALDGRKYVTVEGWTLLANMLRSLITVASAVARRVTLAMCRSGFTVSAVLSATASSSFTCASPPQCRPAGRVQSRSQRQCRRLRTRPANLSAPAPACFCRP